MSSKKDLASSRLVSKKEKIFNWIIFVLLLLGAVVMVFPLIYMIATSFMTKNQILSGTLTILPDPILIGKYSEVLKKGQFINGIFNSLKVAIPVLIIGGFTSSLAAFGFAKMRFRGKNALFLALLATIMIPFAVVMIPQYVMFTKLGWTNTLLPLIIPGCFGNVSIIFFLRQNLIGIPDDLMEAAKIDGATKWQTLTRVTIPNIMPSITICLFLTITNGFKLFDQNLALTNGQPFEQLKDGSVIKTTEMLALNIYNTFYGQSLTGKGVAQAKAVIFFILVAGISIIQLKATRSKEVQQ